MSLNVLFVCLGNICRSPMAEAICAQQGQAAGLELHCDSAGTANYHPNERPDYRTLDVLMEQGIHTTHLARQIRDQDWQTFDYILAMDAANLADLKRQQQRLAPTHAELLPMGLFDPERGDSIPNVPDPYYGEIEDFREVYTQLERCCGEFLNWVQAKTA